MKIVANLLHFLKVGYPQLEFVFNYKNKQTGNSVKYLLAFTVHFFNLVRQLITVLLRKFFGNEIYKCILPKKL